MFQAWKYAVVTCAVLHCAVVSGAEDDSLSADTSGMLRRLCFDCHGNDLAEARINLEQMLAKPDFGRGFKDWEKVAVMLRQGKMPPADSPQPSATERSSSTAAIEESLQTYIRRHAGDPGPVVLQRLTSAEFDYTIEDLTGLDLKLGRRFVSDGVGGEGFTNVGGAQFVEDSTLEQYLDAAKQVADHAVIGAGPLSFFEHPGETGRELSAITRIKEIYRRNGFRTAAGEGATPFGLDLYPRAMFIAWQYRHRKALERGDISLERIAKDGTMSVRFCEHVAMALNGPASSFPLSLIVAQWQSLPVPAAGRANEAEIRTACDRIGNELHQWQSVLAASAGDEEEAAVLTEGEVRVRTEHAFEADLDWDDGAKIADIEFSVATASKHPATGAIVVWRKPRIRFVRRDNRRGETISLTSVLSPETKAALKLGRHPADGKLDPDEFVLGGETRVPIRILIPETTKAARLFVEVELDTKNGSDAIVRCRISDGAVDAETVAEVGDSSTLLGNPASPAVAEWQKNVAEFARLLPEVSHREPAPSDRDPIPPPYDNTYNMPERNHFHTAIKYHRDDRFLVEKMLDEATRNELDQAWTDLLTSYEYHDVHLRFAAKKFNVDLGSKGVGELQAEEIRRFPADVQHFVQRLSDEYHEMQRQRSAAETRHVDDAIQFARRTWRRPLAAEEERRLRDFYATLRRNSQLPHADAMRAVLVRSLVSPAFLYRVQSPTREVAAQQISRGISIDATIFLVPSPPQPSHVGFIIGDALMRWLWGRGIGRGGESSAGPVPLPHPLAVEVDLPNQRLLRQVDGGEGTTRPLSDWELASRLSYFVWSSLPDDELLRAAAAGKLTNPDELARQTRRMLRDPKASRLATEFFGQWLGFYRFDEYRGIDGHRFPEFDEALKTAMHQEAINFLTHIIRTDRPVAEILFANYSFMNERLADHYRLDVAEVLDGQHVQVTFENNEHRGGLFAMAAVLTPTSAPLRTSAVKRGDWVLRRVLGTPVPPPPADAGSIAADDAGKDGLTVRQRLEAHRTDKACVNCHSRIDPLGFALEHYDPLGRWRDTYRDGQRIDASGVLSDGTAIDGMEGLREYLRKQQPQFERNLCTKLLAYALGRAELASDRPIVEEMLSDLQQDGRIIDLAVHIVTSKQFRYRRL